MKEIKKVALGVIAMALLLVAADWAVGSWSEMMYYKSKYGIFCKQIHSLQESNEDILILGSSRAVHHYIPKIFEDSLKMTCYNAGSEGMCIYYHYVVLASCIERKYYPRIVVYDAYYRDIEISNKPEFTLDAALDRLLPHYGNVHFVDSLFDLRRDFSENVKLLSKTYRYNSKLVQTIKCNYIPWSENKGFEALNGTMSEDYKVGDVLKEVNDHNLEDRKLTFLQKLITMCKENDIKLVICYSPFYNAKRSTSIDIINEMAKSNGIPFLDYSQDEKFQKLEYFHDPSHLNEVGALAYTKEIIKRIKVESE